MTKVGADYINLALFDVRLFLAMLNLELTGVGGFYRHMTLIYEYKSGAGKTFS
jgi:hypothetical protein